LQKLVIGGFSLVSLVTTAFRFSDVVRLLVVISLRLMAVVACWVVQASRKSWVLSRSTVRLERLVLTLSAIEVARAEDIVLVMLSSRTKATARMVLIASVGNLGDRDTVSRILTSLDRS